MALTLEKRLIAGETPAVDSDWRLHIPADLHKLCQRDRYNNDPLHKNYITQGAAPVALKMFRRHHQLCSTRTPGLSRLFQHTVTAASVNSLHCQSTVKHA